MWKILFRKHFGFVFSVFLFQVRVCFLPYSFFSEHFFGKLFFSGFVDDVEEFVKDIAGELVDSVLQDVVMEVAKKVACEVCFEEDAHDVWEFRRRGSA